MGARRERAPATRARSGTRRRGMAQASGGRGRDRIRSGGRRALGNCGATVRPPPPRLCGGTGESVLSGRTPAGRGSAGGEPAGCPPPGRTARDWPQYQAAGREARSAGLLSTPNRRGHFRAPGPGMTESQSTFRSKGPPSGACPQPPAPSRPRRTPPHPLVLQARRWLAERCPCLQHLSHPGWLLALSPSVHGVTPVVLG